MRIQHILHMYNSLNEHAGVSCGTTVKPELSDHSNKNTKLGFNTNYRLMQVKSIAECSKGEHSAILSTSIKLSFSIMTMVLSIFIRPLKTCFTVVVYSLPNPFL